MDEADEEKEEEKVSERRSRGWFCAAREEREWHGRKRQKEKEKAKRTQFCAAQRAI